jgi:hypothetical protein
LELGGIGYGFGLDAVELGLEVGVQEFGGDEFGFELLAEVVPFVAFVL